MKLCIITQEDAREPQTWSRTPLSVIECMEKENVCIENLSYLGKIHHYGLGKIKSIYSKIFYSYGNCFRDPFPLWYRIHSHFFEKEMRKYDSDAFLFMGEQCLKNKKNIKGKVYVYLDRIIGEIAKYEEDTRKGKRKFINDYKKIDKKSLECMDHIFTLNDWCKKLLINSYGISEKRVTKVGVGINLIPFYGEKNYCNYKMLIVLRKGTEHYKGLDLLLDAFSIVKESIPNLTLHVVGTDYVKKDGVFYYFDQPRSVTVKLFQECSLYVMPALLEPNGTTYLEALANKTPIIGLNRFAFPEFCGYGKYGFIVNKPDTEELAKCIENAYKNPKLLKTMGDNGQNFVLKQFTWDNVTQSMLDVIKNDLGEI